MKVFIIFTAILLPIFSIGQSKDSTFNPRVFSEKTIQKIESNINSINGRIEKKTLKTLQKLQKQEKRLQGILAKKDSLAAVQLFTTISSKGNAIFDKYKSLSDKITKASNGTRLKEYIPSLDSLTTSLKFLNSPAPKGVLNALQSSKQWSNKISSADKSIEGLQSRLQQANEIKTFIKERKQQIKEQFEKYGLGKHLKKFNKQAYYYQQQLNEYKAMLKDPKKMEQRAIAELRKLPAFTAFMKKNSQLASLFRLPDNYGTPESLAGLQTRTSVQSQLQQRFGANFFSPPSGGVGGGFQQQMGQAKSELNKLKDKVNKLGGGSSDMEMPDFKPNEQKTKSFLKRIEYGANVQSQKTNSLLPVTSDFALTAGYKLNDKSVIGIGVAYKLGWGSGWEHIKLSHQGIGLRSYIDWKIPSPFGGSRKGTGSFWISGGYEQNYQHAFKKFADLPSPTGEGLGVRLWQTSGLMGLTKKYKIGKKTNNLQLLWDFLSYQQVPRRQPVLFRVGVGF